MPRSVPIGDPLPQFGGMTSEVDVRNVILVVIDDLGVEQVRSSGKPADAAGFAPQPTLDALAARGVSFSRFYTAPACSMTRAKAKTGRHEFHTGMGGLAESTEQPLLLAETCLPRMIDLSTAGAVRCWMTGKHHISTFANGRERHPVLIGYEYWAGSLRNLERGSEDYYSWNRFEDRRGWPQAHVTRCNEWAPRQNFADALAWIREGPEPFFCWIAVYVPHTPYQRPPA